MTHVYIVERGEQYEDFRVDGVFATKELAERWARQNEARDRHGIYIVRAPEEVIEHVDILPDPKTVTVYHGGFEFGDLDITVVTSQEPEGQYDVFEEGDKWCAAAGTDKDRVIKYVLREVPKYCNDWNRKVPAKVQKRIDERDYTIPVKASTP